MRMNTVVELLFLLHLIQPRFKLFQDLNVTPLDIFSVMNRATVQLTMMRSVWEVDHPDIWSIPFVIQI